MMATKFGRATGPLFAALLLSACAGARIAPVGGPDAAARAAASGGSGDVANSEPTAHLRTSFVLDQGHPGSQPFDGDDRAGATLAAVPAEVEVVARPWRFATPPHGAGAADAAPVVVGGADQPGGAPQGAGDSDLAKKLANPIADLISIPLQFNYDRGYGTGDDGYVAKLNVQPVIPISLSCEWNLISRTILPLTGTGDMYPGDDGVFGLGDTVQSLFLSPKAPTSGGLTWGAGPVFLLPTATDDRLGADKWGAGPTVVGLVQKSGWTVGLLANHIWSFAGADDRPDVNATLLQPFVSYTTPTAWTFTLNTESTYDWEAEQWSVPVNALASKIVKMGPLPVSIGAGVRYWAESPDGGPEDFGLRLQFTILLPKR